MSMPIIIKFSGLSSCSSCSLMWGLLVDVRGFTYAFIMCLRCLKLAKQSSKSLLLQVLREMCKMFL